MDNKSVLPTKWVIIAVAVGVIGVLGMMIASVVIGSSLTKDVYVGTNNVLMQESGSLITTAPALYTHSLSVFTPFSVLEGIKSIDVNVSVDGVPSIYHMEVMSYLLVPKKKLTLFGTNRQVEIGLDGKMTLQTISKEFKRSESVKRDFPIIGQASCSSSCSNPANEASNYIIITSCADLLNIQVTGNYLLALDLECTLTAPLCNGAAFTGSFDGGMNSLTVNMNCDNHAGLFYIFNGIIANLNIFGSVQGFGYVGAFGAHLYGGNVNNCGSYATVTCNGPVPSASNSLSGAGGFFGNCQITTPINFQGCVSQGSVFCYGTQGSPQNFAPAPAAPGPAAINSNSNPTQGSQPNYASGYVGCLTTLNQQISSSLSELTFQNCISVPVSCQANSGFSSPFANPINSNHQICNSGSCNHNWNCNTCYFDQRFGSSYCGANPAPGNWLTCPPVQWGNGQDFHYTCNSYNSVFPVNSGQTCQC